jgi:hypothetical protein
MGTACEANMARQVERWAAIPGYVGYEVSTKGNVRRNGLLKQRSNLGQCVKQALRDNPRLSGLDISIKCGVSPSVVSQVKNGTYDRRASHLKILKGRVNSKGYLHVVIHGRNLAVHALIALAFLGPKPKGATGVRHLNDNKVDNRLSNLAYGNNQDQQADIRKNKPHIFTSRYEGVFKREGQHKWFAFGRPHENKLNVPLGSFDTESEAAAATKEHNVERNIRNV